MKVYSSGPYKTCVGRKYRYLPKLYRPFTLLISGNFCNQYFTEKNKIRFINQFLRWFYKSRWGYKISYDIKLEQGISEGNSVILCSRTQKAAFKNLLAKLNYELSDYDELKRHLTCQGTHNLYCTDIDNSMKTLISVWLNDVVLNKGVNMKVYKSESIKI